MECDELIQEIKSAFADAPAPSEDSIICHECDECFALRDDVRGRKPDELSDSWVEKSFDQLPFFSDDAKRYYFPAFLRVAAIKPDSRVAQFALFSLSDNFRMQPSGGYSPQQKQAIREIFSDTSRRELTNLTKSMSPKPKHCGRRSPNQSPEPRGSGEWRVMSAYERSFAVDIIGSVAQLSSSGNIAHVT